VRGLILACAVLATAHAVESDPLEVVRVVDGDTLHVVGAVPPGHPVEVAVRLKWIDAPEERDNPHGDAMPEGAVARRALANLLPDGTRVVVRFPGEAFIADRGARTLCLVHRVVDGAVEETSLQERMVAAGRAVYWRRYGDAPDGVHDRLLALQAEARRRGAGVWGSAPVWAREAAVERGREFSD